MIGFLISDDSGAVYLIKSYQARVWNRVERRWVRSGIDWTGIGGATEYSWISESEAEQILLRQGVETEDLFAVMFGLNPDESEAFRGLAR